MTSRRDTPCNGSLWRTRLLLILSSPLIAAISLFEAASEGFHEAWYSIKDDARWIAERWRNG